MLCAVFKFGEGWDQCTLNTAELVQGGMGCQTLRNRFDDVPNELLFACVTFY